MLPPRRPQWLEATSPTSWSSGATTSAGTTSATTTAARWATRRPTSTASRARASSSPTSTPSSPAPPDAPPSSPARTRSGPGSPRSASRARRWACQAEDPTIAELLKPLGYATGQFGKNHLGDLDELLPDEPRLRRVLRQPLSPRCRGRTRASRLSQGPGVPRALRAARRHPLLCRRPHRGHRAADEEAHGDHRRRRHRASHRLHPRGACGGQAVLRVVELHPHARVDAHPRGGRGHQRPGLLQRRHGAARHQRGPAPRCARRAGHRR